MSVEPAPIRRSPVHHWFEAEPRRWGGIAGMPTAVRCGTDYPREQRALESLALCDLSGLPRLGVAGQNAAAWLVERGIPVPDEIYACQPLADDGRVVRTGVTEFLVESGPNPTIVPALSDALGPFSGTPAGVYRLTREDATFRLIGRRSREVFAQTCGLDFRNVPQRRLILTRVAGMSCGILPDNLGALEAYRLWCDYTFAPYLWENLVTIMTELGGQVVGAGYVYPELLGPENGAKSS